MFNFFKRPAFRNGGFVPSPEPEQIGFDAVKEALETSPTLEGDGSHGTVVLTSFGDTGGSGGPGVSGFVPQVSEPKPEPTLSEKHAAYALEISNKLEQNEKQLLADIEHTKATFEAELARLNSDLAETRQTLRFYRTGPELLKRKPRAVASPAKKPTKRVSRRKATVAKAADQIKAPTAPKAKKSSGVTVARNIKTGKTVVAKGNSVDTSSIIDPPEQRETDPIMRAIDIG